MEVKQEDDGHKGLFYIEINNEVEARMSYVWNGTERILIEHTGVSPHLKGTGAGKLMLEKAVEFARLRKIKIVPICSFAKSIFDKTDAYRDVL